MKIYISCTRSDREYADKIRNNVQELRPEWKLFAYHTEGKIGDDYREVLSKNLRDADAIILFISREYNKSRYGCMELDWALGYYYEHHSPVLIPVILDDASVPYDLQQFLYFKVNTRINGYNGIDDIVRNLNGAARKVQKRRVAHNEVAVLIGQAGNRHTVVIAGLHIEQQSGVQNELCRQRNNKRMQLKFCYKEAVKSANQSAESHDNHDDQRNGQRTNSRPHFGGGVGALQQRSRNAGRNANGASCAQIRTGQYDTARNAKGYG